MKKWKTNAKKILSLLMAIVMLMSAWVWVAPTEASAATMGNYDVTVKIKTAGPQVDGGHIVVWYYPLNADETGFDTSNTTTKASIQNSLKNVSNGEHTYSESVAGFPWRLELKIDDNNLFSNATMELLIFKIGTKEIVSSSVGSFHNSICYFDYDGTYTGIDEDGSGGAGGDDDGIQDANLSWGLPAPDANNLIEYSDVKDMTCPKSNTTVTQTVKIKANDQYGVPLYNPKWSVSGSRCGTTGISVTSTTTASESTVITLTNSANVEGTTHSQVGTIVADWGTGTISDTFTITDTKYDVNFSYDAVESRTNGAGTFTFVKDGVKTTVENDVFHGDSVTNIPSPPSYYDNNSYYHTFKGWSVDNGDTVISSSNVPVAKADRTYIAQYNKEYKPADYTALDSAIAAGRELQNDLEYASKYTAASRLILNAALNKVPADYKDKYGIVSQDVIDNWATEINAACNLDLNTFAVLFLDRNGTILLYEKNAEYGSSIDIDDVPDFPEDQKVYYDSTNHYTYTGWDTNEYTFIIDDLVVEPVYVAEAHNFTKTEDVESTCTQKGAKRYICDCGYSYTVDESGYGDHVWETEFTTDLEPTCTVAGSKSIHCTLCDAQKDITAIDPLGHQWSSQSVAVEASCGKIGIMTKVCDDCLFCEHTIIPALEHDYEKTTVAATCTERGYDLYTCSACGHSYKDNYTEVAPHTYGAWETVSEAYCGITGVKKQTCTECGFISLGSIPALEHNLNDWVVVVTETCTVKGYQIKTCSLCENVIEEKWIDALGHNYVEKTVVAPTCTAKGYTVEECNRANCGAQKITNETAALNHAWTSTEHEADCTSGAYVEHVCANDSTHNYLEYINGSTALTHDFTGTETIISAATCTADGEKTVKCSRCDVTTTVILPKLGHSWSDWEKTDATNDTDGKWYRKCSTCNKEETLQIPAGGHNLVEDTEAYVAPTCTTKGKQVYKCTAHENCSISVTVELDFAQHTVAQRETSATCTQEGSVEAYCSVCSDVFSTEIIPIKAHNFVAQSAVSATCTTSGYTPYKCSDCGFTYNVYNESDTAKGHTYVSSETKAATCTATGTMTYTCACGDSYTEEIPAKGHSYTKGATTIATCTQPGTEVYTCSCGDTYTKFVEGVKDHTFGSWVEIQPATTDSYGIDKRTCSSCGAAEHRTTAPTGEHSFVKESETPATCTQEGSIVWKCETHNNCEANYTETLDKLPHTQSIAYTAPTCISAGSSKIVCSVCSTVIMSQDIPAIGYHNFSGEGVKVDASCTTDGTMTYKCLTDGCTATKTETIPAKGHVLKTTTELATCTTAGSVTTECSVCNSEAVKQITTLPAMGHDFTGTETVISSADCETDGSKTVECSRCDVTTTVTLPKLGHNWGKWNVTPSTNTAEGSVERTCATCGDTESVQIPAGGHNLAVTSETPATCTAEGSATYTCTTHNGACGITVTVTTAKLQHTVAQRETPATCTQEGSVEAYCSVCSDVFSTEIIPIKAHNFVAQSAVSATCTTSGYTPYKCSDCGFTYNVYNESDTAKGHTYVSSETKAATCTATGTMTYTCACGDSYTEEIPAKGHSYTKGTTTIATCTQPGTEVYTCSCGDTYTKFVEGVKDHTFGSWVEIQPATTDSYGIDKRTCLSCGAAEHRTTAPTGEHSFVKESETPATCTQEGSIVWKCETHNNCEANYTETLDKLPHTQSIAYTAPTCISAGSSKIVCSVCSTVIMSEDIPAIGYHNFSGEGVKVDATCTTDGTMTYKCLTDGCTATKTETIPAKGHNLTTTVTDAQCGIAGSVVTSCSDCSYSETTSLTAKGHIWGATPTATEAATCEANGSETYKCQNCDAENVVVIPALGHDWGEWTVSKASTNTEEGELSRTCSRENCNKTETIKFPAGGHNLVATSKDDATCTAEGSATYTCTTHNGACGITVTVTTAKLQHELAKTEKEATCTEDGFVLVKCDNCDTETYNTVIPAKGHAYNTVTVKDATCTEKGERKYTCACGNSYTEEIPAKGHVLKTTTEPATCTTAGSVTTECSVCNSEAVKQITTLPAMGHDFTGEETIISSADCETDGSKTVECSRCDVTTTVTLPKLGHSWSDWEKTDATNEQDGSWYHKCGNCNEEETLVIPAGGHVFAEDTTAYVAPTCKTKGQRVYKCTAHENCIASVTVELDYAQHTIVNDNKAATCTENGRAKTYCSICGAEFNSVEIPATLHNYEAVVTNSATCKAEGLMTFTCSKCNDSYTKPIAMIQHSYSMTDETEATCTSNGYETYDCQYCDSSYVVITDAAKTHDYSEVVSSTATCTGVGTMTLKCDCGATMETSVPALGHDYTLIGETSATCIAAATETYKCSRCSASYIISVGNKAEHTFGEWKVIAEATENSLGYKTRSCTANGCGKIELETIDAIGDHVFNDLISEIPATCTTPGEIVYGCSNHTECALTSTVVIPATGHDMQETAAAIQPTCDTEGSTAVYTCKNNCGYVTGGEAIDALGHTFNEGDVTPATCEASGKIVYTCSTCRDTHTTIIARDEDAHQYETTVVDATCSKEGSVTAKCKLCGDTTVEKTLPMIEHTWNYESTDAATCTADGSTNYVCDCGETKSVTIPKLGHNMVAGTTVPATCTSSGYTPYTCLNNGCTHSYNVYDEDASAKAHKYVQVEDSSTADCTSDGTVTLKCEYCDAEITADVPALGHDWGVWSIQKNPTATDEGIKIRSCSRCTETETVTLPKLGHDMVKDEVASVAPSCTSTGKDVYVCSTHTDCGYTYSVEVAMLAHTYGAGVETTKANCTTDGEMTYTCQCGDEITEVIPKTGHILTTKVNEANCEVKGSVVTSCDCGYEIVTDLGFGAHKLKVAEQYAPTCTAEGLVNVECEVCGKVEGTVEIPAKGHDFSAEESDVIDATCEADGSKKVKCTYCDEKTTVVIPAKGHNYVAGESFSATCTESGYTVFTCANNCGNSYSRLDSRPNGHVWDSGTVDTPATCENEGITVIKCKNCDASYEKTISPIGHIWGPWSTTKNPTADEDGEMTRTCLRGCGATDTAPIPALGGGSVTYTVTFVADGNVVAVQTINHGGSATAPSVNKAADESGHYSYIWDTDFTNITEDLTVTAIFTLESHTFGNWTVDSDSTCKVNGSQHRVCSVCDYIETEALPLADHNYSEVIEQKDPTCTTNGYKIVECSVCGKTEKQTLRRLGHTMTYNERVYETCDTGGLLAHYSCSRCGKTFEDRDGNCELSSVVVNKLYHTYVIVEGFAPTCEADGATTYRHCTRCGLTQPSEPIPALGHIDENNDRVCDRCDGTYMEGDEIVCTCSCHKVGFFNEFIYKILRFFWQLFGMNKTCACGKVHY